MKESRTIPVSSDTLEIMRSAMQIVSDFVDQSAPFWLPEDQLRVDDVKAKSYAILREIDLLCQR